jgi:hypothetical protein
MSLSLSLHTNFVQLTHDGRTRWALRAGWEDAAQEMLKKLAADEPIILSMTDAELEVSRSLNPSLTLVFPEGFKDWLSLQMSSFPPDQRESLTSLLAISQCLSENEWHGRGPAIHFSFQPTLPASKNSEVTTVPLPEQADEISTWTSALAEISLREKLKQETRRFLAKNPSHPIYTLTADGALEGVHSPLLGIPAALSNWLEQQDITADNHLFLGWENYIFSYRDSRGSWHSQSLPLQPLNSFKVDPNLKILPEPQGKLFLPMCLSLSPRPTLLDVLQQILALPHNPTDQISEHRLRDSFAAFFNLKWTASARSTLTEIILEEIFWSAESLRTSETCLVEGAIAPLFFKHAPEPAPRGFELGNQELTEAQLGLGWTP